MGLICPLGTRCPLGRFVSGTYCLWDVLSLGCFVPWDVLSIGTFCPGTFCMCIFFYENGYDCLQLLLKISVETNGGIRIKVRTRIRKTANNQCCGAGPSIFWPWAGAAPKGHLQLRLHLWIPELEKKLVHYLVKSNTFHNLKCYNMFEWPKIDLFELPY